MRNGYIQREEGRERKRERERECLRERERERDADMQRERTRARQREKYINTCKSIRLLSGRCTVLLGGIDRLLRVDLHVC